MSVVTSTSRRFGIGLLADRNPKDYPALAREIDHHPFDVVSVFNDLPFHPAFGALLLMAPELRRARFGPAGISPTRMAPIDMAAHLALLAEFGDCQLGIVRGAWEGEYGISGPRPSIDAMEDCAHIVRALLNGQNPPASKHYPLAADAKLAVRIRKNASISIQIGTWGPRLASTARAIADEVKVGGSANPSMARWMKGIIGDETHLVMGCVTVVDENREDARNWARARLARYLPIVMPLDRTLATEPEYMQRLKLRLAKDDLDGAMAMISDETLEQFALAGKPEDIISRCEALYEAGVDRIDFGSPHGIRFEKGLRLLGKKILPSL